MSEFAAWYMPGDPKGFWILRSPTTGVCWAMPNIPDAWGKGLRFRVTWTPRRPPEHPLLARLMANLLGVPGYEMAMGDKVLALAEALEERRSLPPLPQVVPGK